MDYKSYLHQLEAQGIQT